MPIFGKDILIHIPKTGGSSFCKFLAEQHNLQFDFGTADKKYLFGNDRKYPYSLQHMPYKIIENVIAKKVHIHGVSDHITDTNINNYNIYAVIRNPYDRMVSEYFWHSQVYEKQTFDPKKNNTQYFTMIRNEFKKFVNMFLTKKINNEFDNHRVPQTQMIEHCNNLKLIRYESMDDDFLKYFGKKLDKVYFQSPKKEFGDYMLFYDTETKEKVYNYYKSDFIAFDYKF